MCCFAHQQPSNVIRGFGAYACVGFGYDFNKHVGISLNYDLFETRANGIYLSYFNTSRYGGTFEYRF
jgi:hypothetical protein